MCYNFFLSLTIGVDIVCEEEVEFPDRDVDVIGVDTEAGMKAVGGFLQAFTICAL